jgi:hypothetical protein
MKILAALFLLGSTVLAHDHDRPDLDAWYSSLTNQRNGSCCDGSEALSIANPDWDTSSSEEYPYKVFLKGHWVPVPAFAVVKQRNRVGIAKVWPILTDDDGNEYEVPYVRCFLPGSLT